MKSGQIWSIDYILGFLIFMLVAVYSFNLIMTAETPDVENIYDEGVRVSNFLLSEGTPDDWDRTNYRTPGIAEKNRINKQQLEEINKLDFDELRQSYLARNDFVFNFPGSNLTPCVYGYEIDSTGCDIDFDSVEYENLIRIKRYVILDSEITEMNVYVWN